MAADYLRSNSTDEGLASGEILSCSSMSTSETINNEEEKD